MHAFNHQLKNNKNDEKKRCSHTEPPVANARWRLYRTANGKKKLSSSPLSRKRWNCNNNNYSTVATVFFLVLIPSKSLDVCMCFFLLRSIHSFVRVFYWWCYDFGYFFGFWLMLIVRFNLFQMHLCVLNFFFFHFEKCGQKKQQLEQTVA